MTKRKKSKAKKAKAKRPAARVPAKNVPSIEAIAAAFPPAEVEDAAAAKSEDVADASTNEAADAEVDASTAAADADGNTQAESAPAEDAPAEAASANAPVEDTDAANGATTKGKKAKTAKNRKTRAEALDSDVQEASTGATDEHTSSAADEPPAADESAAHDAAHDGDGDGAVAHAEGEAIDARADAEGVSGASADSDAATEAGRAADGEPVAEATKGKGKKAKGKKAKAPEPVEEPAEEPSEEAELLAELTREAVALHEDDASAAEPVAGDAGGAGGESDASESADVALADGETSDDDTPDDPAAKAVSEAESAAAQRKHLRGLIEALVFASDAPITAREIARLASAPVKQVREVLPELRAEYTTRGIHLDEVAGGWVFRTSVQYAPFVRDLTKQKPVRLSRAQVEALAIIAYRQPITRPEIDEVRGVDSGPVLKVLLERDLVRILGKRDEVGRPLIYGTTNAFLEFFGLRSLKDLPTLREFTELTDESKATYEDEIGETPTDGAPAGEEAAEGTSEGQPGEDAGEGAGEHDPEAGEGGASELIGSEGDASEDTDDETSGSTPEDRVDDLIERLSRDTTGERIEETIEPLDDAIDEEALEALGAESLEGFGDEELDELDRQALDEIELGDAPEAEGAIDEDALPLGSLVEEELREETDEEPA